MRPLQEEAPPPSLDFFLEQGPPAHWVEKVRHAAPHLLQPQGASAAIPKATFLHGQAQRFAGISKVSAPRHRGAPRPPALASPIPPPDAPSTVSPSQGREPANVTASPTKPWRGHLPPATARETPKPLGLKTLTAEATPGTSSREALQQPAAQQTPSLAASRAQALQATPPQNAPDAPAFYDPSKVDASPARSSSSSSWKDDGSARSAMAAPASSVPFFVLPPARLPSTPGSPVTAPPSRHPPILLPNQRAGTTGAPSVPRTHPLPSTPDAASFPCPSASVAPAPFPSSPPRPAPGPSTPGLPDAFFPPDAWPAFRTEPPAPEATRNPEPMASPWPSLPTASAFSSRPLEDTDTRWPELPESAPPHEGWAFALDEREHRRRLDAEQRGGGD